MRSLCALALVASCSVAAAPAFAVGEAPERNACAAVQNYFNDLNDGSDDEVLVSDLRSARRTANRSHNGQFAEAIAQAHSALAIYLQQTQAHPRLSAEDRKLLFAPAEQNLAKAVRRCNAAGFKIRAYRAYGSVAQPIFGSVTGISETSASDPEGPYTGTRTLQVGNGPLVLSTLVAVNTVDRSSPTNVAASPNSITISSPGGTLMGVAKSYTFGNCTFPCPSQGGTTIGAVLSISIMSGTGRFASVTGGELQMTENATFVDNGFPTHWFSSVTGQITGTLTR